MNRNDGISAVVFHRTGQPLREELFHSEIEQFFPFYISGKLIAKVFNADSFRSASKETAHEVLQSYSEGNESFSDAVGYIIVPPIYLKQSRLLNGSQKSTYPAATLPSR